MIPFHRSLILILSMDGAFESGRTPMLWFIQATDHKTTFCISLHYLIVTRSISKVTGFQHQGALEKSYFLPEKNLEVFSVIPDLKGRKTLHDRIVPRETKYIEKLQQKDT